MNHNSQKLLTRSSASAEGPRDAPCHRDVVNCWQHNCRNKLYDKSTTNRCNATQLEHYNRRTSSKQPRRADSVFNKLDRQRVSLTNGRLVVVSWRNYQSPEFETKFQRDLLITRYRICGKSLHVQTSSIRSTVSILHRLVTDRRTNRHTTRTVYTALAKRRAVKIISGIL